MIVDAARVHDARVASDSTASRDSSVDVRDTGSVTDGAGADGMAQDAHQTACPSATCLSAFLGTGQSLSQGHNSVPPISTTPTWPDAAFMTNLGVRPVTDSYNCIANPLDGGSIDALQSIEESTSTDGNGETIGSGALTKVEDLLSAAGSPLAPGFFSANGVGSQPYVCLKKTTQAYQNMLTTLHAVSQVWTSSGSGRAVNLRAVTMTHGESDFVGLNAVQTTDAGAQTNVCSAARTSAAEYENDLVDLQVNVAKDAQAITGQDTTPILFVDQMSSSTTSAWAPLCLGPATTADVTLAQLQASLDHPNSIVMVAPKYQYGYLFADGVHLPAVSEEQLGEKYGEAFYQTFFQSAPSVWKPLFITAAVANGAVVTLSYNIPTAPLVLDTTWVNASYTQPGVASGFHYSDPADSAAVVSVALAPNKAQVLVTLTGVPHAPTGQRCIDYAFTGYTGCPENSMCNPRAGAGCDSGPICGPRGNLHDSDPLVSRLQGGTGSFWSNITGAQWIQQGAVSFFALTVPPSAVGALLEGQVVSVTGMTPSVYNTTAVITGVSSTGNVVYVGTDVTTDPGAATVSGVATVNNHLWNWAAQQQFCF